MIYYTDASYSPQLRFAVIGIMYFNGSENQIDTYILENCTNTEAEIHSVLKILSNIEEDVKIYTDCMTVVNLPKRREKLLNTKRQQYIDFFQQLDNLSELDIKVEFEYVKGHKPFHKKNQIDREFAKLDLQVRKQLRSLLKS